ncbi:serine hydrolase [Streptomyces sp. NPDC017949]|uniref:D-alanyl-D-alanine carboxypeptidase n=1 Tax=Streptomyces sp. NPDC017949 TaxID=3365020 RepID=UPI003793C03A
MKAESVAGEATAAGGDGASEDVETATAPERARRDTPGREDTEGRAKAPSAAEDSGEPARPPSPTEGSGEPTTTPGSATAGAGDAEEATSGPGDGTAGAGASATTGTDAETDADPAAEAHADADADPSGNAGADTDPDSDARGEADSPEPASDRTGDSAGDGAGTVRPAPELPEEEAEPDTAGEPVAAAAADAEPDSAAAQDAEPADAEAPPTPADTDPREQEDAPDAKAEPPAADTEADADSDADTEADADADSDADADADSDAEAEADSDADSDADADADADPDAPEAEADPQGADPRVADAEAAAPEANPETADPEPKPDPAKPEPAKPEPAKPEPAKPEPAKSKPAKPEPKPRPAEPAPADDPERTSTFVALKDPRPAPARATAPPVVELPAAERTREAPLPPLDLLAELTNTAPPPETPRRTITRRVKVWTPILLLLGAAAIGGQLLRPLPAPQLVGDSTTYAFEGSTQIPWPAKGQAAVRVPGSGDIGSFGEQKPVPTASVAKVMTAYVILKGHPLRKNEAGPRIEVDAAAVADGAAEDESRIEGLTAGQTFSQQDMLKMLMIPSGNNVARLLARWDTGTDSTAAFVAKMNAAAKELGMNDTTYTDPSGLDAGTVSTAADQIKLGEAVMKEEAFRAIVAMPNATIEGLPKPIINNNDNLLLANGLSIKGIKTGSSTPAGGTLLWAAYKTVGSETRLILGAMMEQRVDGPDPNATKALGLVKENSRKVIEAVRTALTSTTVIRKGQLVGHLSDGLGGSTPLVATKDVNVIGVPGQELRLSLTPGPKSVPHEAKAGTEVGVLTVGEGDGAKSVPVAVEGVLDGPSFVARVTRLS